MSEFILSFFLTIIIESSILYLILRKGYGACLIFRSGILASGLTLPFVWFLFPFLGLPWIAHTALAEIFAVLAEAGIFLLLFRKLDIGEALRISFFSNAASFAIGFMIL